MYSRFVIHHPQPGKNAELSNLIQEHVNAENAAGTSRNAFFTSMFQPLTWPESPSMVHAIMHEDFGDWEKHITNRSPGFQEYASKMFNLTTHTPVQILMEILELETSGGRSNFVWQTRHTPLPGKGMEVRKLLAERVKTALSRGAVTSTLQAEVFGNVVSTTSSFADLPAFEAYRKGIQTDQATASWAAKLQDVSAGPAEQILSRVVVPFPAP